MLHLLKILEINHLNADGALLWRQCDINNIFHLDGEDFLLNVAFNTSSGIVVPGNYYLGMDNRSTLQLADTLANLSGEPTQAGYARQTVSSLNGFEVALDQSGNWRATSAVVLFQAIGGAWGPVTNLFLTDSQTNTGFLISSAALDMPRTLAAGQSLTIRFALGLQNC